MNNFMNIRTTFGLQHMKRDRGRRTTQNQNIHKKQNEMKVDSRIHNENKIKLQGVTMTLQQNSKMKYSA